MKDRNLAWSSVLLLIALLLPACGGSPTTPPTPAPTPTPCIQSTLFHGSGALPANTADFETFTTTTAGRVDVTLDWTFPSSSMGVFVAQGPCSLAQLKASACTLLLTLVSPPKPLKGSVASVAPGTYGLIIANPNSQNESVAIQAVLSSSTCPAVASASNRNEAHVAIRGDIRGEKIGILHH